MNSTMTKQLEAPNLKILKDQLNFESLIAKKYSQYSNSCSDNSLKPLFDEGIRIHKQNFTNLKNYLDSHQ
ncbi:hypothetical protein IAI10_06830 [Clostridium sp. 19966]|uniref:hypothetical protein n=1 Tax=Clostridium sp. 19966 TaxID=2768166 RepID=UPI0028DED57B|nr:hypothetical protein [Clostridium sp. 19966]MDT8716367.1 hypothetical protein [Clostridium sp. 19966]